MVSVPFVSNNYEDTEDAICDCELGRLHSQPALAESQAS